MNLFNNKVVLTTVQTNQYPNRVPFDPAEKYPEYTGKGLDQDNKVYAGVRESLFRLGLDRENYNTAQWNPFGEFVKPGMKVFIKPNTCTDVHENGGDILSAIIHASVLRPVLDYVCIALQGNGRIIIGDSQLIHGRFDRAMVKSQIEALVKWYSTETKIPIECFDLRTVRGSRTYLYGKWGRKKVEQDPRGYRFIDLGDLSYFKDIDPKRLRVAIASYKNMIKHHSGGKHEYLFPQSLLDSDIVISIPKLKTHRRTAITLAIKNFMGIPAWKDSLPHFTTGSVEEGGDQFIHPSIRKKICTVLHDQIQSSPFIPVKFACALAKKLVWNSHFIWPFKDDVYEAMWQGNDTVWRTLLDLNRAVFFADREGKIQKTQQRGYFCLIDGIIGGEGDGPLSPDPVYSGTILAGFNPVAVDAVASTHMGFNINKIPLVQKGLEDTQPPCELFHGSKNDISVIYKEKVLDFESFLKEPHLKFKAHPSWAGHVELE